MVAMIFLNIEGEIPADRHQLTLRQICEYLKVGVSEATGESCACVANKKKCCYDLFYYGQNLYHLFILPNNMGCVVKYKKFDSQDWEIFNPIV